MGTPRAAILKSDSRLHVRNLGTTPEGDPTAPERSAAASPGTPEAWSVIPSRPWRMRALTSPCFPAIPQAPQSPLRMTRTVLGHTSLVEQGFDECKASAAHGDKAAAYPPHLHQNLLVSLAGSVKILGAYPRSFAGDAAGIGLLGVFSFGDEGGVTLVPEHEGLILVGVTSA